MSAATRARALIQAAGPALFILILLVAPAQLQPAAARVLGLAVWMGIWWVTEAVPLAATSLLPIVVLPLAGVRSPREAAEPYGNELIFLFLAGFIIAAALEKWHSHSRIAYGLVAAIGTSTRRVVLGVMIATGFVSMWISNTATAAMMFPITLAIGELFGGDAAGQRTRMALLLGMSYAASIGGMATLIGTPPNLVVAGAIREITGQALDFGRFMLLGFPLTLVLLPLTWALLVFVIFRGGATLDASARDVLEERRRALGPLRGGERLVLTIFVITALTWFFREPKDLGGVIIPGLTQIAPRLTDTGIGILASVLLFTLPGRATDGTLRPLLRWEEARTLPWDVLLLFGGGLSLAAAMDASGLTQWIASGLEGLRGLPLPLLFLGIAVMVTVLSEFASNLAVATMMMPLAASLATAVGQPPTVLMLVAGFSASLGFALPVATPPNAIVFGSGKIPMGSMIRAGLVIDLAGILVVSLLLSVLTPIVL
jgi:solute carrier family 13 (sodium-dependent dicarboxylate transporter), member 2/3/5